MGLFEKIKSYFKPEVNKPAADMIKSTSNITSDDLHITEGVSRRLNAEKLELCLAQGLDNEAIREAVREKQMIEKNNEAEKVKISSNEDLYQWTSAESKKIKILRSDDPKTKQEKREKREKLWDNYHKQKAKNEMKKDTVCASSYGEKFFADLALNQDTIGWEWCLSSRDNACKICKKNAGRYRKGQGPKFPAHEGCTCSLTKVFEGEKI